MAVGWMEISRRIVIAAGLVAILVAFVTRTPLSTAPSIRPDLAITAAAEAEAEAERVNSLGSANERSTLRKADSLLKGERALQSGELAITSAKSTALSTRMLAKTDGARIAPENVTMFAKTASRATGGNTWDERSIVMKKGETLSAILRDLGGTPEEIKAIAAVLGQRGRDGYLKEGQRLRVLVSPIKGSPRLQPVRVTVVGESAVEAVAALSDLGKYVAVESQVAAEDAPLNIPETEKLPVKRYTLEAALSEAGEAFGNEPPGMLKSVHTMIYVCRISEMLNAGFTSEQIAAQQHIAAVSSARCSEQWAAQFVDDLPTLQLVFTLKQVPRNTRDVTRVCHFAEIRAAGYEDSDAMLRSLAASPTKTCSERVARDMLRYINGAGPIPPEWNFPLKIAEAREQQTKTAAPAAPNSAADADPNALLPPQFREIWELLKSPSYREVDELINKHPTVLVATVEKRDFLKMTLLCRASQMLVAGYGIDPIKTSLRSGSVLLDNPLCTEQWARAMKSGLQAIGVGGWH
jgi:hypothetical protein